MPGLLDVCMRMHTQHSACALASRRIAAIPKAAAYCMSAHPKESQKIDPSPRRHWCVMGMRAPLRRASSDAKRDASACAGEEGAFRLVGGEVTADVGFGVPQIFHAGAWGTFCNGDDNRYDYFEGSQYLGLETFNDVRAPRPPPRSYWHAFLRPRHAHLQVLSLPS